MVGFLFFCYNISNSSFYKGVKIVDLILVIKILVGLLVLFPVLTGIVLFRRHRKEKRNDFIKSSKYNSGEEPLKDNTRQKPH